LNSTRKSEQGCSQQVADTKLVQATRSEKVLIGLELHCIISELLSSIRRSIPENNKLAQDNRPVPVHKDETLPAVNCTREDVETSSGREQYVEITTKPDVANYLLHKGFCRTLMC
jgi:hypothetical protein